MLSTTVQEKLGTVRSFPSCYDYRAYPKAAAVISELQVDQHVLPTHHLFLASTSPETMTILRGPAKIRYYRIHQ
ncbi:unnamed protein product [Prunus armeniaca]|uniref:Uncharacterized protein n=1 Tax=Prunus armeniaca TaxID=36596 RepID=A0A6J5UKF7_PRUAR|nr:unnamed protein product [Prunus armeniaca]